MHGTKCSTLSTVRLAILAGCERDPTALQAIFNCLASTFKALLKPLTAKLPEMVPPLNPRP